MSISVMGTMVVNQTRFHQAVAINEEVKRVVKISNEVNMAALNAMLIAKRSGRSAAGFGVVSVALRNFSQHLDKVMAEVGKIVAKLVITGANLCRQLQRQKLLRRTTSTLVEETLFRKVAIIGQLNEAIAADKELLLVGLLKAKRLCAMGGAISRSARIESVHCQAFSGDLQQVSDQVEQSIAGMMAIVKSLHSLLAEEHYRNEITA